LFNFQPLVTNKTSFEIGTCSCFVWTSFFYAKFDKKALCNYTLVLFSGRIGVSENYGVLVDTVDYSSSA
ncbi:hypothetical protein, partial [Ligilactobacillus pobuzihii]